MPTDSDCVCLCVLTCARTWCCMRIRTSSCDRIDTNDDGVLSVQEFTPYWKLLRRLSEGNARFEEPPSAATKSSGEGKAKDVNRVTGAPKKTRMQGVIKAKAAQARKLFARHDEIQARPCVRPSVYVCVRVCERTYSGENSDSSTKSTRRPRTARATTSVSPAWMNARCGGQTCHFTDNRITTSITKIPYQYCCVAGWHTTQHELMHDERTHRTD